MDGDEAVQWCLDNEVLIEQIVDGEPNYRMGPRCEELAPSLYQTFMSQLHETLLALEAKGLVDYYIDAETEEFVYDVSPEAEEILRKNGFGYTLDV